jgi:hypothetical protein
MPSHRVSLPALIASGALTAALFSACGAPATIRPKATAPLTMALHLDRTRAKVGPSISGVAVLTNHTTRALTSRGCLVIEVGLANSSIPFDPAFVDSLCLRTNRFPPGARTIKIAVLTTYLSCAQNPLGVSTSHPACTATGMPPLPPGQYSTKVVAIGLPPGTALPSTTQVTLSP